MSRAVVPTILRCMRWGILMGASAGAFVGWFLGGSMNIGFRGLFWLLIGGLLGTGFGLVAGLLNGLMLNVIAPALAASFSDYMRFKRHLGLSVSITTALLIILTLTILTDLTMHDPLGGALIGLLIGTVGGLAALYAGHRNAAWFWSIYQET